MQKKLIALAVAGLASTAAFAQVTVYGVADATLDMVSASSPVTAGDKLGRTSRISANSSYFGFKGSEDLGGGLSALFQFEAGAGFDSGAAVSLSRDSFVGLSSQSAGTVLLGQLTGPTRALGAAVDVYAGATGIGTNGALIGKLGNTLTGGNGANSQYAAAACTTRSSTCVSVFDTRWKNAIAYVSPNFAGVTLTAAFVANENKTHDAVEATAPADTKGTDFGVKYVGGPLMAGLSLNTLKIGDLDNTKASDLRLVGKYDFGFLTVAALVDQTKLKDDFDEIKQRVAGLGLQVPVGSGKIVGQYYVANDVKVNGTKVDQTGAKLATIGYEHSLSKRTLVKALYSSVKNDDLNNYDFGVNAVGVAGIGTGGDGANVNGFSFGVRHTF